MDSSQLHRPLYSPSSYEVRWRRWKNLNVDRQKASIQGVENYFTESLLYQDSLKTDKNPQPEKLDSGNKADVEAEVEEECLWELNTLVTSINKFDVNKPLMM